jgi:hypothetical protein
MSISITYDTLIPTTVGDAPMFLWPIVPSDYATAKAGCVKYFPPINQMTKTQFNQFFKSATNASYLSMLDTVLNMTTTKNAILTKYNSDMGLMGNDMKEIISYNTNGLTAFSDALNACDASPITFTPSTTTLKNYFQIIFKFTCGTGINAKTYTIGCEYEMIA